MIKRILALMGILIVSNAVADAGDRSVITTRHMPATPDQVIQAFVDSDDLAAWWLVTRSLVVPETGGVWSITWDDWGEEKSQHAWSGVISDIGPGRLVVGAMVMMEPDMPLFGPMQLEIVAEEAENGSTVTVTHSGYGYGGHWDEMYRLVVNGWDHVLGDMQTWFDEGY